MPNTIYYSDEEAAEKSLNVGDFYIGTGDVSKAPTDTTSFFNGINPPSGGYTIYLNKSGGKGPSITCPGNDADLIAQTNEIANASYTTVNECLTFFAGQSDKMVMFNPINAIVTDGLIAFMASNSLPSYPRSGTTWYDLGSESANFTIPSDAYNSNSGVMNYTSDQSSISPPAAWQSTTDLTVEVLYKPNTGGIYTGCCDTIFGRYDFRFFQIGASLYAMIGFDDGNGTRIYQHPAYTVAYDEWHHVLAIRRDNRYIIWIDGVEKYNTTYGTGLSLWDPSETYYLSTTRHTSVDFGACRVYTKGLSDSEILQNYYQAAIVTDDLEFAVDAGNLVSYYNNVPYNATVNSLVGTITGTLTNGVVFSSDNGGYWDFDGVDDYINLGNMPAAMDPGTDGAFSFGGWIKTSNESGFQKWIRFSNYYFYLNTGSTYIRIYYGGTPIDLTVTFSHGEWVHWFAVVDRPNNILRIYKNGVQVAINTSATATGGMGTSVGMIGDTSGEQLGGETSIVHYYKKALTAAEVGKNYSANINRFN